jgi:hypothetical protein
VTAQYRLAPFIHNPTVFALGILLIEICLGKSFEDLRMPEDLGDDGVANPLTEYVTAVRLLNSEQLLERGGPGYEKAVRLCIKGTCESRSSDLNDDEYRQAVYDGVVTLIEADADHYFRSV